MPITIQDDQLNNLRDTLTSAKPAYDRMTTNDGDTRLSQDEKLAFGKVYDQVQSIVGNQ